MSFDVVMLIIGVLVALAIWTEVDKWRRRPER
jgi:hypothetical protein